MKYLFLILFVLILASLGSTASAWERPTDCAPDQREIEGNAGSPCKPSLPPIESVTYRVTKHYPNCIEEMVFHVPGATPTSESGFEIWRYKGHSAKLYSGDLYSSNNALWEYYRGHLQSNYLVVQGAEWNLNSAVRDSRFGNPNETYPYVFITPMITDADNRIRTFRIKREDIQEIEHPRTDNVVALANACLALVRQEKADREHAVAVAQAEADAEARRQAERDAAIREQEQAKREAETQARVAEAELAAARESQRIVAETELLRTQTLKAQLAHEETIAGILQEIARIRLAGQQDRARLTNEYLVRAEASAEAFNVEVEEIQATIQRYLDFNSELLTQLDEYRANISTKLREAEQELAEQQARIEALGRVEEETPGPGNTN